jgi:hypothetical protein
MLTWTKNTLLNLPMFIVKNNSGRGAAVPQLMYRLGGTVNNVFL